MESMPAGVIRLADRGHLSPPAALCPREIPAHRPAAHSPPGPGPPRRDDPGAGKEAVRPTRPATVPSRRTAARPTTRRPAMSASPARPTRRRPMRTTLRAHATAGPWAAAPRRSRRPELAVWAMRPAPAPAPSGGPPCDAPRASGGAARSRLSSPAGRAALGASSGRYRRRSPARDPSSPAPEAGPGAAPCPWKSPAGDLWVSARMRGQSPGRRSTSPSLPRTGPRPRPPPGQRPAAACPAQDTQRKFIAGSLFPASFTQKPRSSVWPSNSLTRLSTISLRALLRSAIASRSRWSPSSKRLISSCRRACRASKC